MGIPKYHKWLTDRYPQAFQEKNQEVAEHVYVDVNSLLHDAVRHATSQDAFFSTLFSKFDALFRAVVPTQTVFLGVDGPASCAKCLTQRQRRRQHLEKDSRGAGRGKAKGKGKNGQEMSSNMLTPGVPFMAEVTAGLEYYAASRMAPGQPLARCRAVTVSGANAIGEGEHKIVSQLLRHAAAGAAAEAHVIISGDADIFLLSLVQSAVRRVRVVSERPLDGGAQKRKRGVMLTVWDAEALAACVHAELPPRRRPALPTDEAAVRRDFALISLLAGNDYLPPLSCGLGPQKIWERYVALRRANFPAHPLVEAATPADVVPPSHSEEGWAPALGDAGSCFAAEPYERFLFHGPLLVELMKTASAGAPSRPSGQESAEGVRKYLMGLLWILEMYHHGHCGDFYFIFEKNLHRFASASLIVAHLAELTAEAPIEAPASPHPPMRPTSCAICILPAQHAEKFLCAALPELRPMFVSTHPLLGEVNARELSTDIKACKAQVAAWQQQMMSLRSLGRDDSEAKRELTRYSQMLESLNKSSSDIDTVPLWEVDAEVAERCAASQVGLLSFAPDSTFVRGGRGAPAAARQQPATALRPPVRGWPAAACAGLQRVDGEWPSSGPPAPREPAEAEVEEEAAAAQEDGYPEQWDDGEAAAPADENVEEEVEEVALEYEEAAVEGEEEDLAEVEAEENVADEGEEVAAAEWEQEVDAEPEAEAAVVETVEVEAVVEEAFLEVIEDEVVWPLPVGLVKRRRIG